MIGLRLEITEARLHTSPRVGADLICWARASASLVTHPLVYGNVPRGGSSVTLRASSTQEVMIRSGSLASGEGSSADPAGSFRRNVTEDSGIVTANSRRTSKIGHPSSGMCGHVRPERPVTLVRKTDMHCRTRSESH